MSDLTIGDFWNYFSDNVNSEDIDDDKGISMLLINTQNGKSLFNKTKEDLIYFAKDFQKSIEKALACINLQKNQKHMNNFGKTMLNTISVIS